MLSLKTLVDKYSSNPTTFQSVIVKITNVEIQMKVIWGKQGWIQSHETWATGVLHISHIFETCISVLYILMWSIFWLEVC